MHPGLGSCQSPGQNSWQHIAFSQHRLQVDQTAKGRRTSSSPFTLCSCLTSGAILT